MNLKFAIACSWQRKVVFADEKLIIQDRSLEWRLNKKITLEMYLGFTSR